jgi:hypothetical protein
MTIEETKKLVEDVDKMTIEETKKLVEDVEEHFKRKLPCPFNYPNSFKYYLKVYKYNRNKK